MPKCVCKNLEIPMIAPESIIIASVEIKVYFQSRDDIF